MVVRTSQRKTRFHGGSFANQTIGEHIQTQTYAGHGVAEDHSQQR